MSWRHRPITWILAGLATVAAAVLTKAATEVLSIEFQTLYSDTLRPYIVANAWSWVVAVFDLLSGFWGGVLATVIVFFCFYLLFSSRRFIQAFMSPSARTTGKSQQRQEPTVDLAGLQKTDRTDYDLIPLELVLSGKRTEDGIDVWASIRYKNRGRHDVFIKPLGWYFELDGKKPVGKVSSGVSNPVTPGKPYAVQFTPIRLYEENNPTGSAGFVFRFGASRDSVMNNALEAAYKFRLLSYPESQGGSVTNLKIKPLAERLQYYE